MKAGNLGAMLALGALTALPACSMFGGGSSNSGSSQYTQSTTATPPASYGAASKLTGEQRHRRACLARHDPQRADHPATEWRLQGPGRRRSGPATEGW